VCVCVCVHACMRMCVCAYVCLCAQGLLMCMPEHRHNERLLILRSGFVIVLLVPKDLIFDYFFN